MLLPNTRPMQTRVQKAIAIVAAMTLAACGAEQVTATSERDGGFSDVRTVALADGFNDVVISQVYGGGGNSGATYQNDFVELHNRGSSPVSLSGLSIQYASAAGSSWTNKLDLSGNIPAGGYYLVRLATNGAVGAVLGFDQSGSINMSGTAGKLILANTTTAQTGTCPTGSQILDRVAYGANATPEGCGTTWGTRTANLSNTTAAIRADNGCKATGVSSDDFTVAAPNPRTSASSPAICTISGPQVGPLASITVTPASPTIGIGATQQLVATGRDANSLTVTTATFTWSSSNTDVATVSATGLVTAVSPGAAVITATSESINGSATITVSEPATLPSVRFTEIHYDNTSDDFGEALEIEGPAGTDLTGWKVVLYNGSDSRVYDTRTLADALGTTCTGRGVMVLEYSTGLLQNGGADGMALVDAAGQVIEFLSYEGVLTAADGPAAGRTSRDIGVAQSGAALNTSLQRSLSDTWSSGTDNFGVCNGRGTRTPRTTLSFGFRTPFDEPLPVGFEDLLTVTERLDGVLVGYSTPLVSETPEIAEVLANNVIRGTAAGTARFRATAANGFTLTYSLPIKVATAGSASYASHTDFGTPFDASPVDDYLLAREQSTVSYSSTRNTPNWVAYNLEASHMVSGQDRCDCFTFDPALPQNFSRYSTFDYVGSGYSRGHLVKSADRTSGSLDNARTFYFSNIVPQTSANNGGPWLQLENYLSNKARDENKEIFIVTGVAGSLGTVNDRGLITIPASLWKVAIVLPRNKGLTDVNNGLVPDEVIAVVMPNVSSMPSGDWKYYSTTVDAVEQLSGYNVFDKLEDQIEIALESNTKAPVARVNGPFEILAGESVTLSASASTDADGDALTFAWAFGDGRSGTGVSNTVKYDAPGTYTATVTVSDIRTLFSTASTTVKVLSSAEGLIKAADQVQALGVQNKLNRGLANSLAVKIRNAGASIDRENVDAARGQLGALVNEIEALVQGGKLKAEDAAAPLLTLQRVIASLAFGV